MLLLDILCNFFYGFPILHTRKLFGMNHFAIRNKSLSQIIHVNGRVLWIQYGNDLQIKRFCKLKVSLVMGRYRHNGSRSIVHENIIRNIYRNAFPIQGINGISPQKFPRFFPGCTGSLNIRQVLAFLHIFQYLLFKGASFYQRLHKRMLW